VDYRIVLQAIIKTISNYMANEWLYLVLNLIPIGGGRMFIRFLFVYENFHA